MIVGIGAASAEDLPLMRRGAEALDPGPTKAELIQRRALQRFGCHDANLRMHGA